MASREVFGGRRKTGKLSKFDFMLNCKGTDRKNRKVYEVVYLHDAAKASPGK